MSSHARWILTPGASRKRKEREPSESQKPLLRQTAVSGSTTETTPSMAAAPLSCNRLLAGFMAYEFLSKGTVLGQKFDVARLEAMPFDANNKKVDSRSKPNGKLEPTIYAEVANLLKSDGAYLPGVVNPTQLARWIQM
ncbi:uncharacterized protein [Primulina eburnea]|uniref:uncharacterized protein n=1 Tax=Primulina eburnea TaxID=1245227 RepID=UPI003C6BD8CF